MSYSLRSDAAIKGLKVELKVDMCVQERFMPMPLRTVLIVDDVAEDRMLFRNLLARNTEHTYRFLEATTGSQSLELCRAETPDCLLLNYELPDMSGTAVLQSIVAEFGLDRLPIVMLSSGEGNGRDGGIDVVVAALHIGAQDFLVKDRVRAEDLHRAISNAIEKVSLRQQQTKAEQEMHTSEARYQSALTAGRMGTWETDLVARTRMWSKEGMALFGITLAGGRGQVGGEADEYRLALHPEDRHLVKQFYEQADRQDSFAAEYRIVRPDGTVLWLAGRGQVVARGPHGKAQRLVSIMADATERKAAEDKVHVSEIRYRRLFEAAHDGVLLLDPDTCKIIDANPFMTKLLGYSHDQLVGKELFEIGLLKDEAASQEMFQKLTREHQVRYEDLPLESQGGRNREVEVVANLYDENGRFVIQCNIRDITDRKHRELSLALLAEISQDLIELKSIDEVMQRIGVKIGTYLNLSVCAFMEINEAADEAIVTHEWHRADAPSLASMYRISDYVTGEFQRACRAGETFIARDTGADPRTDAAGYAAIHIGSFVSVPLIRAGEWRFLVVMFDSEARDWRDSEIELIQELTTRIWSRLEHARAEEALRESENRFRIAEEASNGFIYDWDVATGLEARSDGFTKVLGYTNAEFPNGGAAWEVLMHPDDMALVRSTTEALFTAGAPGARIEYRLHHKDGRWLWVLDEYTTVRDERGGIRRVVGSIVNITERKQAELDARFLANLAGLLNPIAEPDGLMWQAVCATASYLGVTRAGFSTVIADRDQVIFHRDYCVGVPSMAGTHKLSSFGPALIATLQAGGIVSIADTQVDERTATEYAAVYAPFALRAALSVPLLRDGQWLATFWVADSEPRAWTHAEVELLRTATERTWLAIENAQMRTATQMLNATLEERVEERTAKLRESQLQLRALSVYVERLREDERTRIAREVHDQLGSSLTGLKMSLARAAKGMMLTRS
jgi:PAS domain S-box-containing protein